MPEPASAVPRGACAAREGLNASGASGAVGAGQAVAYRHYRDCFHPRQASAVHWAWSEIAQTLAACAPSERGSLTLSTTGQPQDCQILPGIALNIQVVPAGGGTRSHAHAWWHLFLVHSGHGEAVLGSQPSRVLQAGDILLVPAWVAHHFRNGHDAPLLLLSLSNLPQQSALSNHLAREPESSCDS